MERVSAPVAGAKKAYQHDHAKNLFARLNWRARSKRLFCMPCKNYDGRRRSDSRLHEVPSFLRKACTPPYSRA
jgi:hypothetical protein